MMSSATQLPERQSGKTGVTVIVPFHRSMVTDTTHVLRSGTRKLFSVISVSVYKSFQYSLKHLDAKNLATHFVP